MRQRACAASRRALPQKIILACALLSYVPCRVDAATAPACHSSKPDDLNVEKCEPWCSDGDHCGYCKCRGCKRLGCTRCQSTKKNDISVEDCEDWCEDADHCGYCKCKACPHLQCKTGAVRHGFPPPAPSWMLQSSRQQSSAQPAGATRRNAPPPAPSWMVQSSRQQAQGGAGSKQQAPGGAGSKSAAPLELNTPPRASPPSPVYSPPQHLHHHTSAPPALAHPMVAKADAVPNVAPLSAAAHASSLGGAPTTSHHHDHHHDSAPPLHTPHVAPPPPKRAEAPPPATSSSSRLTVVFALIGFVLIGASLWQRSVARTRKRGLGYGPVAGDHPVAEADHPHRAPPYTPDAPDEGEQRL